MAHPGIEATCLWERDDVHHRPPRMPLVHHDLWMEAHIMRPLRHRCVTGCHFPSPNFGPGERWPDLTTRPRRSFPRTAGPGLPPAEEVTGGPIGGGEGVQPCAEAVADVIGVRGGIHHLLWSRHVED